MLRGEDSVISDGLLALVFSQNRSDSLEPVAYRPQGRDLVPMKKAASETPFIQEYRRYSNPKKFMVTL